MSSHLGLWHYHACILLMMVGLFAVISRQHLVKKILGLTITQVSVIMFFVAMGKVRGGTAPILETMNHDAVARQAQDVVFSNPIPHVLMLTAIVVGVATNALALSFVVRIKESYGTAEEDEVLAADHAASVAESAKEHSLESEAT